MFEDKPFTMEDMRRRIQKEKREVTLEAWKRQAEKENRKEFEKSIKAKYRQKYAQKRPSVKTKTKVVYRNSSPIRRKINVQKLAQGFTQFAFGGITPSSTRPRGRPPKSYKPKVLPNGQIVQNMPIQQFRKLKSVIKKRRLLQQELRKARLSAIMPNDPRFQFDPEEAQFLNSSGDEGGRNFNGETIVPINSSYKNSFRPPSPLRNFMNRFRMQQQRPLNYGFSRPDLMSQLGKQDLQIWGGMKENPEENILNARNVFNNQQFQGFENDLLSSISRQDVALMGDNVFEDIGQNKIGSAVSGNPLNAERLRW